MIEPRAVRSGFSLALAQFAAAGFLGLVVLPSLFWQGASAAPGLGARDVAWLVLGLLATVWLLTIAPALTRGLSGFVGRWEVIAGRQTYPTAVGRPNVNAFAEGLVAVSYVLVVEAVLRRPAAVALGGALGISWAEALFAATALVLLLLVLFWLYRAARPLVEVAAWHVLDAVVATSGSETSQLTMAAARAPTVAMPGVTDATRAATESRSTRLAGQPPGIGADATRLGPKAAGEPALSSPDVTHPAGASSAEATSVRRDDPPEATIGG